MVLRDFLRYSSLQLEIVPTNLLRDIVTCIFTLAKFCGIKTGTILFHVFSLT